MLRFALHAVDCHAYPPRVILGQRNETRSRHFYITVVSVVEFQLILAKDCRNDKILFSQR